MENENLTNYFNAIVEDTEHEEAGAHYRKYVIEKTKEIVAKLKHSALRESIFNEMTGDSPIRLHGDDVLVNGKLVGHVKNGGRPVAA